jgi:hypothetical protein
VRRGAQDDDAAPLAALARADRRVVREDDRVLGGAHRLDLGAAADDQRGALGADDLGARLDGEHGGRHDEDVRSAHAAEAFCFRW